jgi:hypothetical protein
MSFNNAVKDGWGQTAGFRCFECGWVFQSMWGDICNGCRKKERRHQEMLDAIKRAADNQ